MGYLAGVVCRELGISTRALAYWADKGKIRSTRTAGNWRLYNPADVKRLKREIESRRKRSEARA